jgi:ribosome biogenesis GTPase
MPKQHDYQKELQKHVRKQQLSKARKKARPNASPDKPRQRNWEQFQDEEWDLEGFYEEERVMPKGHDERRRQVREMIKKPVVHNADLPSEDSDQGLVPNLLTGTVIETTSGRCKVSADRETIDCFLRGNLQKEEHGYSNVVAVGDQVAFKLESDGRGVVENVLPRHSVLSRTAGSTFGRASGQRQIVAANIDRVLIVASWRKPNFWPELLDRYLIAAERNQLEAVICVNKIDLIEDHQEFESTLKPYRDLGYVVLSTSAEEKSGISTLREFINGGVSVLAGLSGVGKSSLLSAIQPGLNLKTLEVGTRGKNKDQGRHTTRMASYYPLSGGGAVIDTPGIRDFGLSGLGREEIKSFYPEFTALSTDCAFHDCLHLSEPVCGVRQGVNRGTVSQLRYENYTKIIDCIQD